MARILIVDDEEPILAIVSEVVEEMGHEVLRAMNGREALDLVRSTPLDLVLTDVMMPFMSGIELCQAVKTGAASGHIVVVLMSAVPPDRALRAGADGFVHKPFALAEIEAAVVAGLETAATTGNS